MSINNNILHIEREFLNPLGVSGGAYIYSTLKRSRTINEFYGHIEITDCNHKINLHYDVETNEDKANALYRLDKLIHVLMSHRNALNKIEFVESKPKASAKKSTIGIRGIGPLPPVA